MPVLLRGGLPRSGLFTLYPILHLAYLAREIHSSNAQKAGMSTGS